MTWLEFISQMTSAIAWPAVACGALILLRNQIKAAAAELVARVSDIRRLKAPGVDVEFEQKVRELARATEQLEAARPIQIEGDHSKTLPPETPGDRMLKYRRVADVDPRGAIIAAFIDLESYVRSQFSTRYPDAYSETEFRDMVSRFRRDDLITSHTRNLLDNISELRNLAAHDPSEDFNTGMANEFIDVVTASLDYLRHDFKMSSTEG